MWKLKKAKQNRKRPIDNREQVDGCQRVKRWRDGNKKIIIKHFVPGTIFGNGDINIMRKNYNLQADTVL